VRDKERAIFIVVKLDCLKKSG